MKNKLNIDEYGVFLVYLAIGITIIAYFANSTFLYSFGFVMFLFSIYRAFSKQKEKREMENNQFKARFLNPIKKSIKNLRKNINRKKSDKDHKYISCPICGQKLRIPKKKGKIKVRCPKCGSKFDARS